MDSFSAFIANANGILWGYILIILLLGAGIYFTVATRFIQFRRFRKAVSTMLGSRKTTHVKQISSFQAFCTSMAARVGTGNLAGVAVALYLGGAGAIFWMWVVALLGMATSLIENTLAQVYKTNNGDGTFVGGPAFYMQKALKARWMGILFSIALIIAYGFAFNSVQANTIANSLHDTWGLSKWGTGIVIAMITAFVISGGIRSISKVAELLVPFMASAYLIVALIVILINITAVPAVLLLIVKSAFGLEQAAGGAIGVAIMNGVKRGLFSNEAGMGSAPNAAATAAPQPNHPASMGFIGMLGVFTDTIIICTATAFIILLSGVLTPANGVEGILLTQSALAAEVGEWGRGFISLAVLLFAFTSIIGNYYYGESSLRFIKDNKGLLWLFRASVVVFIIIGSVQELSIVWNFADLSMAVMAIINLTAILLLSKIAFTVLKDFEEQIDSGQEPSFDKSKYPTINNTADDDIWTGNKK